MLRFRPWCLVLAGVAMIGTNVTGQEADPFAGKDPLRQRIARSHADPVTLTFRVLDQQGSPVAGTRIRGPGIFRPLHTDESGTAVWQTGAGELRKWATRSSGSLRFHAGPPPDAVMPEVSEQVSLATLIGSKSIEFRTVPGVRLSGRVIGQRDKQPVAGVTVTLQPDDASVDAPRRSSTTDERGMWSIVVPRVATTITLSGYVDGYKLQDASNPPAEQTRVVEIPKDSEVIQVSDFEVQQYQPQNVLVTDTEGNPVPNANLRVLRERWLDDRIVTWQSISSPQQTDENGACLLQLSETDWNKAIVAATTGNGNDSLEGRAILDAGSNESIRVLVHPLGKVGGFLLRDGKPAAGIDLLLYEATQDGSGNWTTIGVRSNTVSDGRGAYLFDAPVGIHYIVATKDRDRRGKQRILHRTTQVTTADNYRVPDLDLSALPPP